VLAIFKADEPSDACCAALKAERLLREKLVTLNDERALEERPTTDVYIGLHIGDVFYGNIGSQERLDFTVIGPAVNEVSRIASICRSVDFNVLMSSDFAAAIPEAGARALACVGRYALRGVQRPQELFTLDTAGWRDQRSSPWPPSTQIGVPVMWRERSLARKRIASATSSLCPASAATDRNLALRPDDRDLRLLAMAEVVLSPMLVSIAPGQTALTRMPCLPSSSASCCTIATWPALVAE
jgi:hypothetical protein